MKFLEKLKQESFLKKKKRKQATLKTGISPNKNKNNVDNFLEKYGIKMKQVKLKNSKRWDKLCQKKEEKNGPIEDFIIRLCKHYKYLIN